MHSSASVANAAVAQWAFDNVILQEYSNDMVVLLDHDMFMCREFSVKEYMTNYGMSGIPQVRGHIKYHWIGILFFDLSVLPNKARINIFCGLVRGKNVDAGGMLWYYIHENPEVAVRDMEHTSHIKDENSNLYVLPDSVLEKYHSSFCLQIVESSFVHYGGASNWKHNLLSTNDFTPDKTSFFNWLMSECLSGSIKMPKIEYSFKEV